MSSKFKVQSLKFFSENMISKLRQAAFLLFAVHCLLFTASAQLNSGAQQNVNGRTVTFAIRYARLVNVSGETI